MPPQDKHCVLWDFLDFFLLRCWARYVLWYSCLEFEWATGMRSLLSITCRYEKEFIIPFDLKFLKSLKKSCIIYSFWKMIYKWFTFQNILVMNLTKGCQYNAILIGIFKAHNEKWFTNDLLSRIFWSWI